MNEFFIYDEETYPNIFSIGFLCSKSGKRWEFEISEWRNDWQRLAKFVTALNSRGAFAVGFNNVHFDYPVLHYIMESGENVSAFTIYERANAIIQSNDRYEFAIWENNRYLKQLDLFLIHHFDNIAKATSLKAVEFAMRAVNIGDLPYPPGTTLTYEQSRELIKYMWHDIEQTRDFFKISKPLIDFRFDLSEKFGQNFINDNDVKIGTKYFINKLEAANPGSCYTRDESGKLQPHQTPRNSVKVNEIIFPYIQFNNPEFNNALEYLKTQTIYNTRGGLSWEGFVDGVKYKIGSGGIHASVDRQSFYADDDHELIDIDVTSFYPSIPIVNRVFPEHLGETFCDVYAEVKAERLTYPKKTPENGMLKLALNGVYGQSNSEYSPFYDPKYTMTITINGQLLILMLVDRLMMVPGIKLIQFNTDGVTVRCPRIHREWLDVAVEWWQHYTKLDLEEVTYKQMHIRDVNNYIAETTDGTIKRVGAYEYAPAEQRTPIGWHQDFSALVVQKCAEAVLLRGVDPIGFVRNHHDFLDFAKRARATSKSTLWFNSGNVDRPAQKITRYYVSVGGETLIKKSPPPPGRRVGAWKAKNGLTPAEKQVQPIGTDLDDHGTPWDERYHTKNRSKYTTRITNECAGKTVTDISNVSEFLVRPIDYDWYIAEVKKLTDLERV